LRRHDSLLGSVVVRVKEKKTMPRNKDLKRVIRARMQKTGEAYTSARAQVINKASTGNNSAAAPLPTEDYAALAGTRDDAILARTGRTWEQWTHELDTHDAAAMPHREIATLLREQYGVDSWWSQNVTVGYERIKGLRERGQRRDGGYEAGKSRTYGVAVEALFEAWADDGSRRRWLGQVDTSVRTATAPRNLRLQWPDGTIVVVGFSDKGEARSSLALVHQKLPDRQACERAKAEWSVRLEALGRFLADGER
jgi:hypothetical protein